MNNLKEMKPDEIVREAEQIAKKLSKDDKLKTSQLRNFYSSITRMRFDRANSGDTISDSLKMELNMLKPKLAYAAGRHPAVRKNFYDFIKRAIDDVVDSKYDPSTIDNFFMLIEGIVAYHKFYGDE